MTKGRRFLASFGAEARKLSVIFARCFVALFGRHRYGLTVRGAAAGCSVRPQGGGPGFGRMEEAARTAGVSCPSGKAGGESCVENVLFRLRFRPVLPSRPSDLVGPRRTVTVLKRDRALWVPLEIRGDEGRGLRRFSRGVLPCPVTAHLSSYRSRCRKRAADKKGL